MESLHVEIRRRLVSCDSVIVRFLIITYKKADAISLWLQAKCVLISALQQNMVTHWKNCNFRLQYMVFLCPRTFWVENAIADKIYNLGLLSSSLVRYVIPSIEIIPFLHSSSISRLHQLASSFEQTWTQGKSAKECAPPSALKFAFPSAPIMTLLLKSSIVEIYTFLLY